MRSTNLRRVIATPPEAQMLIPIAPISRASKIYKKRMAMLQTPAALIPL